MEIHLVRHGETEWSANGRHTSITDLDLTERGVAQARALHGRLDLAKMDLVLSSPRLRARRTADLAGIGEDRLEFTEELAEWSYGQYEGLTSDQIRQSDPDWTIWTGHTPGGETAEQVTNRLQSLIDRLRQREVEQVLCFAHGHSLRALTLTWLGLDFAVGEQFPLDTGSVSVLGDHKDQQSLLSWNVGVADADR
ncbi:MAG: histidine phosphatase family protein [Propionibacteriales bacterium]|nr:histidine phosphatase family protein [Propionibacteriales bacterium]